ncbi:Coenzyme F420 hydrogenase/dehydrogenase, beta subunit C-terminal domain [Gloeobacter kilaueensis]|uniref:Coenzyme F420-reducing hydrogenase subunit beta n=1 Tax=Gloeobacter kilaueensis (strain ATCC BAA-2537 / CCAP 1431/1 / ULC 316 / JS1) TaxID=1183438 RepID=U5QN94_GLOK1|nr:Coenzyme F420 hydrogenase/dehydrogenase, beta subunit C-terminal domain [Gloeobacter kilaueensis]AGY60333.1 coenzyme F420-reducing hydrogenase subunit beta [Gloeobacter kilaueensis JS1]
MTQAPIGPTYPLLQKRICSNCGLCNHPRYEAQVEAICPFSADQVSGCEAALHGRERNLHTDELYFGVFRSMHAARLRTARPDAQTGGAVTAILERLLTSGKVEAVLTARRNPDNTGTPVLVRDPAELRRCGGSRWDLVPVLDLVPEIKKQGIRRLAVVGVGCQISALRAIEAQLGLEQLYVVGLVCTDNMTYANWQRLIAAISRSPRSVTKLEFMADFRIWLWHEDGSIEKLSYFELPMSKLRGCFPSACTSCFDQINGLADLSVGYMAADIGWQWLIVRNGRGAEMFDLISGDLEFGRFNDRGNRTEAMKQILRYLGKPALTLPSFLAQLFTWQVEHFGPRGLEFARLAIENKQTRNWYFLKTQYPEKLNKLLPRYVRAILDNYKLLGVSNLSP